MTKSNGDRPVSIPEREPIRRPAGRSPLFNTNISLDLTAHCIETELKRVHTKSIADYFKADETGKAAPGQIIEAVCHLLETVDFPKLRTTWPALAGHTDQQAILSLGDGDGCILLNGKRIDLPRRVGC